MIQSMTGFVSKSIILESEKSKKIKLFISIKSLNSRYFDITCRLPYVINQYEIDLIRLIKMKLYRGNIYLMIQLDDHDAFKTSIQPAIETIAGYLEAANQIQKKFNIQGSFLLSDIMKIPNAFILEENGIDEESKKFIFNIINELLDNLVIERKREGSSLKEDLEKRISLMEEKIKIISDLFEKSHESQKEKISKKIHEINEISHEFAESQRQMFYLTLDKMDIHEEISRFKVHLLNMTHLINLPSNEKGKQLDFTLQELFREINTIISKTSNSQITDTR